MNSTSDIASDNPNECVIPSEIPVEVAGQYRAKGDEHAEKYIAQYVASQASDEEILNVELIKTEVVSGQNYEIWDVATDVRRWWVITNLTNLYAQDLFKSLDYTLSFHIGLMLRVAENSRKSIDTIDDPFLDIFRRLRQAEDAFDASVEPEDFQKVGLLLREALTSFSRRYSDFIELAEGAARPKASDFKGWMNTALDSLCSGEKNKELRSLLKNSCEKLWVAVNWITHDKNASKTATLIALEHTNTVTGHLLILLERNKIDLIEQCPNCASRNLRSYYDSELGDSGDYYTSCGSCDWLSSDGS